MKQKGSKPSIFDVPRTGNESGEKPRTPGDSYHLLAVATTIPFALLAGPLFGYALGVLIDKILGTSYFSFLLAIIGLLASFNLTYRLIRRLIKM